MTSTLSWLDADDSQRQRMREAVELFREEGAVDETGMGKIRDALSERLFPGTSVLWRRARYLLFVPWVIQSLEQGKPHGMRGATPEERARRLQMQLAAALNEWADSDLSHADTGGIIGRTKLDVLQTPDLSTWAGLEVWGVRRVQVPLAQARRSAVERSRYKGVLSSEDEPPESIWHPRLPTMPVDFPKNVGAELEPWEAGFLADQLLDSDPTNDPNASRRMQSLMPVFLRMDALEFEAATSPWDVDLRGEPPELAQVVAHAGAFSEVVRGAQLTYVRLVAQARDDEQAEAVLAELEGVWAAWLARVEERRPELERWESDLAGFWAVIHKQNSRLAMHDKNFVKAWARLTLRDPAGLATSKDALNLIIERENRVKGVKARLRSNGQVGRDSPMEIPRPLTFRWDVVHNVIADIRRGIER